MDITYALILSLARTITAHPRAQVYLVMFAVCSTMLVEITSRPFPSSGANVDTVLIKVAMFLFLCAAMPPSTSSQDTFAGTGALSIVMISLFTVCVCAIWDLWARRGDRSMINKLRTTSRLKSLVAKFVQLPMDEILAVLPGLSDQDLYDLSRFLSRTSQIFFGTSTEMLSTSAISSLKSKRLHKSVENNYNVSARVALIYSDGARGNVTDDLTELRQCVRDPASDLRMQSVQSSDLRIITQFMYVPGFRYQSDTPEQQLQSRLSRNNSRATTPEQAEQIVCMSATTTEQAESRGKMEYAVAVDPDLQDVTHLGDRTAPQIRATWL